MGGLHCLSHWNQCSHCCRHSGTYGIFFPYTITREYHLGFRFLSFVIRSAYGLNHYIWVVLGKLFGSGIGEMGPKCTYNFENRFNSGICSDRTFCYNQCQHRLYFESHRLVLWPDPHGNGGSANCGKLDSGRLGLCDLSIGRSQVTGKKPATGFNFRNTCNHLFVHFD